MDRSRPLWVCPRCGRQFRHQNTQHTCGQYNLGDHFTGKDPLVRDLYDDLMAILRQIGPVIAYPLKARIVFQGVTQFAAAITHRHWLEVYIWLRRRATHPRITKVEMNVFRDYGHIFHLDDRRDLDEEFVALLKEAYIIGSIA